MPYDFYLESENERRAFSEKTFDEMHKYIIKNLSHYLIENWLYFIFKDNNDKEVSIKHILSRISENRNIYTYSSIGFFPTKIRLSIIGDSDVDIHIYKFVVWCQKHYPCQLYEEDYSVPPEELFPFEEEGFVPLIS